MNKILNRVVWLVILAPGIYLAIVWNKLPEIIPVHFDIKGNADRYGNKKELLLPVIIISALSLFVYFLFVNVYRLNPKKYVAENKNRFQRIGFAVSVFLASITCYLIYSCIKSGGSPFNLRLIFGGIGLLWCIIGNYMYNIKPNYFAGFRTKWTLNNEENWKKTHLLAGKLWFIGGLLLTVVCLCSSQNAVVIIFLAISLAITIIPGIYSYRLYKKQKAFNSIN